MSFDTDKFYSLLPAIYRIRDVERGEPLKALLSVIAEQASILEEDLAQLYDDQFIETCADWVVPYIGDLIGHRILHGVTPQISSPRAEVANTIGYRRRKGTVVMLEQFARDVTGWSAHVVEFFQLLATTQHMNHLRLNNTYSPDLRQWEPLERLNTAFDSVAHTVDVRHITNGRGRYNIPNIGIFLWRLGAYSLTRSPAFKVDGRRYLFSPLGNSVQLFSRPQTESEFTQLSQPIDVPAPLSRRVLDRYLADYYGTSEKSILLNVGGQDIIPDKEQPSQQLTDLISVCNLSDITDAAGNTNWANMPQDKIAIDPVLGRIAFPQEQDGPVLATFQYGFSAEIGGGEYTREATFTALHPIEHVPLDPQNDPPSSYPDIQDAIDALNNSSGVVEITDSGRYAGPLSIHVNANEHIELRAADLSRPILVLGNDPNASTMSAIRISGDTNSRVTLNGLLISGGNIQVSGELSCLSLRHCTVVPGLSLSAHGEPQAPFQPGLIINTPGTTIDINQSIIGGLQMVEDANVWITSSIVDALAEENVAYAARDGSSAGGTLNIENSTIIGKVNTFSLALASNSIFLARLSANDTWVAPILSEKRQDGCVRFSYLPLTSRVPRRYHCQPASSDDESRVRPYFTSLRFGDPGYCQLYSSTASEIRQGAEDEAEMGVFHDLQQPQRETNLRMRLDEYLRFGLEAGIIYAS
jgi:hypothetical protein